MRYFLIVCILGLALVSCGEEKNEPDPPETLVVGTFNIQFLSDTLSSGDTPRSADDYAQVSRLIEESGFNIMAVQEVRSVGSLDRLKENGLRGSWEVVLGESGGSQHCGILYDTRFVESLNNVEELGETAG
ncbi:hypothetical protein KKF84_04580, partial [Myxococcota bacterium]|nr:hypothetical protein [Myxococcota bacterium]